MKNIALCFCLALAGVVSAGTSSPVRIVPKSVSTAHWASIRSSVVSIPVVIPEGCDAATLAITNLAGEVVVSQSFNADATYAWTVFTGAAPKDDDLFTVTLTGTYGGTVLSVQTATLALVKGAFGAVEARTDPSDAKWRWTGDNLVLPYSCKWDAAETAALEIAKSGEDTVVAELAGTGWYGKRLKGTAFGSGDFSLTLGCGEDEWTATVERLGSGTMLLFR